ncbi:mannose-6-phosphate isomerase, partial [Dunaliella salina]
MLSLQCQAQNYGWGRPAGTSEVAKLAQLNGSSIDESQPYAELWMGTHPNCPSMICTTGSPLAQWIEAHPDCLGLKVQQRFGRSLPFLFK